MRASERSCIFELFQNGLVPKEFRIRAFIASISKASTKLIRPMSGHCTAIPSSVSLPACSERGTDIYASEPSSWQGPACHASICMERQMVFRPVARYQHGAVLEPRPSSSKAIRVTLKAGAPAFFPRSSASPTPSLTASQVSSAVLGTEPDASARSG